ncbi:MAG: Swt1 family HEPN domain-containing protein [Candidatus Odinarchaeota archaeon]
MYTLITQTLNIAGYFVNPDYYNQMRDILEKESPHISKRFMSIMGILTALKKNLSADLIIINEEILTHESKVRIFPNLEEIFIDFPKKMLEMGKILTEVYFNIFIFETHFRNFIEKVSIKSYGISYWKQLKMNKRIGKKVNNRKQNEIFNKWLSVRGDSDLYYTDFDDLRVIISSNWDIFHPYFPKESWIITYLEDLYKIRNKIAHNIPIEENERDTVKALLNNIYNQLEVNIKYITLFRENLSHIAEENYKDGNNISTEYREEYLKIKNIDFELIFNYLDMIEKGKIPHENLNNTFNAIDREVMKVNRINDINQQDVVKLEEICERLFIFMKRKDEDIEYRILGILYSFTFNQKTTVILKNQCYLYFIQLFEKGRYYTDLIRVLDLFDYFNDKIEEILVNAIDENKVGLLNELLSAIDYSKHRAKRIEIIRTLNQLLIGIDINNNNLKTVIKKIIRKFEES